MSIMSIMILCLIIVAGTLQIYGYVLMSDEQKNHKRICQTAMGSVAFYTASLICIVVQICRDIM